MCVCGRDRTCLRAQETWGPTWWEVHGQGGARTLLADNGGAPGAWAGESTARLGRGLGDARASACKLSVRD